jgi:hypothetical protein
VPISVGFIYEERHFEDGVTVIEKADLLEVSLTPIPANERARVALVKNANTATTGSTAIATWTTTPAAEPQDELYRINAQLGALAAKACPPNPALVDAFVAEIRQELVEEKLNADRMKHLERELTDRAAHTTPVPNFAHASRSRRSRSSRRLASSRLSRSSASRATRSASQHFPERWTPSATASVSET